MVVARRIRLVTVATPASVTSGSDESWSGRSMTPRASKPASSPNRAHFSRSGLWMPSGSAFGKPRPIRITQPRDTVNMRLGFSTRNPSICSLSKPFLRISGTNITRRLSYPNPPYL